MNADLFSTLDIAKADLAAHRAAAGRARLRTALRRCRTAACAPAPVGLITVRGKLTAVCCPA